MTIGPSEATASPVALFLFEEPLGAKERPLFRSATDLAELIIATDPEYQGKKAKSLAAFIHQIARGERPCPKNLHRALTDGIRARVHPAKGADKAVARFEQLLTDLAAAPRLDPKLTDATELWEAVVRLAGQARDQFIITSTPAEQERFGQAETLSTILLTRLNLLAEKFTVPDDVRYTFCLPQRGTAITLWDEIFSDVARRFDPEEVERRLKELHKHKSLRVLLVPPYLCAIPVVMFEPTDDELSDGYVLMYHLKEPRNEVSVARLDRKTRDFWRTNVHQTIEREAISVEDIPYSR
ncbi:MAG: hypothetical protein ABI779_09845 [Acidobacteriota bacterium]